jgi:hypothetical protein
MLNDLNFEIWVNDVSANAGGLLVTLTLYAPWPKGVRRGESTFPANRKCKHCGTWYPAQRPECPQCTFPQEEETNDCPF